MKSFDLLTIVVLGGLGSISGSITAAILLTFVSAALAGYPEMRMVIYSLMLIGLMLFRPQGLFGNKEISLKIFNRLLKGGSPRDAA
jgi:branched-chain amino acid transport system permease protein